MNFIVLDLEWNQYPPSMNCPISPDGVPMRNEIIQIGAAKTDQSLNIIDTLRLNIRLEKGRILSEHVMRLTSLTPNALKDGLPFPAAYEQFQQWTQDVPCILTWGSDDLRVWSSNLGFYGLETLPQKWYDAQRIYRYRLNGTVIKSSLSSAMEHFGIVPDRPLHDALNDAYLSAQVCQHLDVASALPLYDQMPTGPRLMNKLRARSVSGVKSSELHPSRSQARAHARHLRLPCPQCGATLVPTRRRMGRSDNWCEIRRCAKDGDMLIRFRIRERPGQLFQLCHTIKPLDETAQKRFEHHEQMRASAPLQK